MKNIDDEVLEGLKSEILKEIQKFSKNQKCAELTAGKLFYDSASLPKVLASIAIVLAF